MRDEARRMRQRCRYALAPALCLALWLLPAHRAASRVQTPPQEPSSARARAAADAGTPGVTAPTTAPTVTWTEGLSVPESVLHDPEADLYYVSNINGDSLGVDNNGFISRLSPDGKVLDARWIAGGVGGVTLHAPKGMALEGDTLYVADIDTLRMFDRRTGAPIGAVKVEGATFLNDLAVGPGNRVIASDSGRRAGPSGLEPTGTEGIYALDPQGKVSVLARSPDLDGPNGLLYAQGRLWVVTSPSGELYALDARGHKQDVVQLPAGRLDGIVQAGSDFIVSSWEAQALFQGKPAGPFRELVGGLQAPADIGYDARRKRVLVPRFRENRVEAYQLP